MWSVKMKSGPTASLKRQTKNHIPIPLIRHSVSFKDMEWCAAMLHDAYSDHQTSVVTMIDFMHIAGQVAGPCFPPFKSTSRISCYGKMGLISEEKSPTERPIHTL